MSFKYASDRRAYGREVARQARQRNAAFVADINARTVCAHCGTQPIEWHNPEHAAQGKNHRRIARLVSRGNAVATIQAELDRCTPLCRRCHMAEDGRLGALVANASSAGKRRHAVRASA